jgi:ribosomal protein S18 acetylase RimI-like enzyme
VVTSAQALVALRPVQPEDAAFLYEVYASTRADEMAITGWTAAQQEAFLQMQFKAQRQYYLHEYPSAEYHVIQRDGVDIGRQIVNRTDGEILLMDIALLSEHRNGGIGTTLIRDLMAEAEQTDRPLRLHVEFFNRAVRLYERLGFSKIGDVSVYFEMEWRQVGLAYER